MATTKNSGGASREMLDKLIAERVAPGANRAEIDARIWEIFGEDLAVMFTDLGGFSRTVTEFGIIHFLQIIYESKRIFIPCIERYNGLVLKEEGDSLMVIFRDAPDAVACAVDMQRSADDYNASCPPKEQIAACVGVGYGRILKIGDSDIFGAEVTAASKLGEDIAGPREILITGNVYRRVKDISAYGFEQLPKAPPGTDSAYRLLYNV